MILILALAALLVRAENVILLIGDGYALNHIEACRLIEYGPDEPSAYMLFPHMKPVATYNAEGDVTDSAAAATAIATGSKTLNGRLGLGADRTNMTTILELFSARGFRTGLVAKSHLTHATPAAFAAHYPRRGDYAAIAEHIAERGVDLLLGGGWGDDYLGLQLDAFAAQGYELVYTADELRQVGARASSLPLLGLFSEDSLPFFADWDPASAVPSLGELTEFALDALDSDTAPFFLMVEGSLIDWGNHDNNKTETLMDAIEFEHVLRAVLDRFADRDDTLVVVTADHESGGLVLTGSTLLDAPLPAANDTFEEKQQKRRARLEQANITYATEHHTHSLVLLAAAGFNGDAVDGAFHIQDIFTIMNATLHGEKISDRVVFNPGGYIEMGAFIAITASLSVLVILMLLTLIIKGSKSAHLDPKSQSGSLETSQTISLLTATADASEIL